MQCINYHIHGSNIVLTVSTAMAISEVLHNTLSKKLFLTKINTYIKFLFLADIMKITATKEVSIKIQVKQFMNQNCSYNQN